MAKKLKAWIHVGMPGAGDVIEPALAHHHEALVELGVASVARTPAESFRAGVEMTRSHKAWGLKRADVEGQWTRLVRRAQRTRADLVFSQALLASATTEQVALLVDALADHQVHVVVTTGNDDEAATVGRWSAAVRKPERLHVVETDGMEPADVWKAFGRLVGFGTTSLRLDAVPNATPVVQSLPDARRELERLARRNASLEVRLEELDRKRRKLKKKLGKQLDDVA
ncbi:hypothetical protein CFH99_21580 [Nocardioides aromaticivorans]|uniref:Uncharacterized protein n=1 Tax=Nocardioides aromaticivorans TaxID=200618 RepID=A0ABX7PQD8_9ACTN|nr:hypothetical protein [Nocardioides aromaticivorans]QSR28218.1 hypothetical protein CFH99_21580 [Nocardioides aromaticivorans]